MEVQPSESKSEASNSKQDSGQASVEYAVVFAGMLALVIALGALHAFLENGQLPAHALWSCSHGIELVHEDNLGDTMSV